MGRVGADGEEGQSHQECGRSRGMYREAIESGCVCVELSYLCGFSASPIRDFELVI